MPKDLPLISVPVGSVAEIEKLDPELLLTVATCSRHSDGNLGCPSFRECVLPWKGTRPRLVSYREWKQNGKIREVAGHCSHVVRRKKQVEANGGLLEILGDEGSTYQMSGTKRLHPLRDTSCHLCMAGQCTTHVPLKNQERDMIVGALAPASEHPDLQDFERARIIRERREQDHAREVTRGYLNKPGKADDDGDLKPAGSIAGGRSNQPTEPAQAAPAGGE
jgi:hypothetical protein